MSRIALYAQFTFCVWSFSWLPGVAANLYVSPTGNHTAPYHSWGDASTNIQVAIEYATAGDRITVDRGIYYENLNFNGKDIELVSRFAESRDQQDVDLTIIDGRFTNRCFTFISGESSNALVQGFTVRRGKAPGPSGQAHYGGGIFIFQSSPTLKNLVVTNCTSRFWGGGMYIGSSYSVIDNILVAGNVASEGTGGGIAYQLSYGILQNSRVIGNSCVYGGGGIVTRLNRTEFRNLLIADNQAGFGGGININWGGAEFDNVTVVSNRGGGIVVNYEAQVYVRNSIVWYNTPSQIGFESSGMYMYATVTHSDIQGGAGGINTFGGRGVLDWQTGNISAVPGFLPGTYIPNPASPCVNKGTNAPWITPLSTDLKGDRRLDFGLVDMGAYEYTTKGPPLNANEVMVWNGAPGNMVVPCGSVPPPAMLGTIGGCTNPAVGQQPTVTVTFAQSTSGACPGTITRTWTATDACGNVVVTSQVITVRSSATPLSFPTQPAPVIYCSNSSFEPPIALASGCVGRVSVADLHLLVELKTFSSPVVLDSSIFRNHGNAVDVSVSDGVGGGQAFDFDGEGRVTFTNVFAQTLATSRQATVSFWIWNTATNEMSIPYGDSLGGHSFMEFWPDGTIRWEHGGLELLASDAYRAGQWNHVAGVLDLDNVSTLYVNGMPVQSGFLGVIAGSGDDLILGASSTGPDPFAWRGKVGQFRLYTRALTHADVAALSINASNFPVMLHTESAARICNSIVTRITHAFDACGVVTSIVRNLLVSQDNDGDGVLDYYETGTGIYVSDTDTGTDPTKKDTDQDGQSDGIEISRRTDPNDPLNFARGTRNDFDGDARSDIGVYHPPSGTWYIRRTTRGFYQVQFGYAEARPVAGDFDGDGVSDLALYDHRYGHWHMWRSKSGYRLTQFGFPGTIPVAADYDGDKLTDIGVYYPPSGTWSLFLSQKGFMTKQFGFGGTVPVPADYDGDGLTDLAVYYPTTRQWYIFGSSSGFRTFVLTNVNGIPVPWDYGAGKAFPAIYSSNPPRWHFANLSNVVQSASGYNNGATPVYGDLDGHGISRIGEYRADSGMWYWYMPEAYPFYFTVQFGYAGTIPIGAP